MSTLRMQMDKKKAQEEMRRLMAERRKKDQKPVKIDNPLAKYNNVGQLMCILCSSIVRSEQVWTVHINSKQHRENINKAKQLKEQTNNFTVGKLKHKGSSPPKDAPPEKKLKSILKNATPVSTVVAMKPKNDAPHVISYHNEEIKRLPINTSILSVKKEDQSTSSNQEQDSKVQAVTDQPIPEGFFDDPILDAKVKVGFRL